MDLAIPDRLRGWLYVICIFGSLIMSYLGVREIVGPAELGLWSGFTAAVATMARFNLSHSATDTTAPKSDAIVTRRER